MFTGEYRHSIDEKNRLIVPKNFRDDLGMKIVITRGLDGCLFGYNIETWNKLLEKLNTLPFTKKDARNFTRFFTSGAITLEFDKQGRVVLPGYLKEYSSIMKDVVLVGVVNRIEIWSQELWDKFINDNVESLSDISENLFDSSFEL